MVNFVNGIKLATIETLERYPLLSSSELAALFMRFIEENLPRILESAWISPLRLKREHFRLKRGKRKFRDPEKLKFIYHLLEIQRVVRESYDGQSSPERGYKVADLSNPWLVSYPSSNDRELARITNGHSAPILPSLGLEMRTRDEELVPLEVMTQKRLELAEAPKFLRDRFLEEVVKVAKSYSGNRVLGAKFDSDELYGDLLRLTVNLDARKALRLWVRLLEEFEWKETVLTVEWRGKLNVSEDKLADYIAEIMLKSGTSPKALLGFSAVEAVREGWT